MIRKSKKMMQIDLLRFDRPDLYPLPILLPSRSSTFTTDLIFNGRILTILVTTLILFTVYKNHYTSLFLLTGLGENIYISLLHKTSHLLSITSILNEKETQTLFKRVYNTFMLKNFYFIKQV